MRARTNSGHEVISDSEYWRTVPSVLEAQSTIRGDAPFLKFPDRKLELSYADSSTIAHAVAANFLGAGLRCGDKIAIHLGNGPEFVACWLGSLYAGLVDVPVNPELSGSLLRYAFEKADVAAVVTTPDGLHSVTNCRSRADYERLKAVFVIGDMKDVPHDAKHLNPLTLSDKKVSIDAIAPSHLASIRFTSGTSGFPKAAELTHAHMLSFVRHHPQLLGMVPSDTLYTCFPLYHALAAVVGVILALRVGASVAIGERFSASNYWREVSAAGARIAHVIGPVVPILLAQPESPLDRTHGVEVLWTAPRDLTFEDRFGVRLVNHFSMSEANLLIYPRPGEETPHDSSGRAADEFDLRIVDSVDRDVQPGEPGELVFRPQEPFTMTTGYHNDATRTVEAWRNLWFHTGDRVRKDTDGYFYFLGRLGDQLRRRGVNVSPEQLEKVVLEDDRILDCAVFGVPSSLGEDDICIAVVTRDPGRIPPRELARSITSRLPRAMRPRYVEVRTGLPRTGTQKIQKSALRDEWRTGPGGWTWDTETQSGFGSGPSMRGKGK